MRRDMLCRTVLCLATVGSGVWVREVGCTDAGCHWGGCLTWWSRCPRSGSRRGCARGLSPLPCNAACCAVAVARSPFPTQPAPTPTRPHSLLPPLPPSDAVFSVPPPLLPQPPSAATPSLRCHSIPRLPPASAQHPPAWASCGGCSSWTCLAMCSWCRCPRSCATSRRSPGGRLGAVRGQGLADGTSLSAPGEGG